MNAPFPSAAAAGHACNRNVVRGWRRLGLAVFATVTLLTPVATASAASVCYEAFDSQNGARLNQFVRLRTRAAGELVPAGEGSTGASAQSLVDVAGRFTSRTGLPLGQPQLQMDLASGFALVVPGKGAQMSLIKNFGRAVSPQVPGFSALDCGSATASATPTTWICRGAAVERSSTPLSARSLRLTRIGDAALRPECRDFVAGPS